MLLLLLLLLVVMVLVSRRRHRHRRGSPRRFRKCLARVSMGMGRPVLVRMRIMYLLLSCQGRQQLTALTLTRLTECRRKNTIPNWERTFTPGSEIYCKERQTRQIRTRSRTRTRSSSRGRTRFERRSRRQRRRRTPTQEGGQARRRQKTRRRRQLDEACGHCPSRSTSRLRRSTTYRRRSLSTYCARRRSADGRNLTRSRRRLSVTNSSNSSPSCAAATVGAAARFASRTSA